MNQQNQGPGSSNPSPAKRKRGRPRKEGSTVQASTVQVGSTPVRFVPDIVINPNQTAGTEGTTGSANDEMLGKVVTGVIEGSFGGGYLLNVRVGDSSTYLRGVVFQPGQYVPVTPENDVAPHLEMIQRIQFPSPVLNPQAQVQSSIPSSGQGSKQPVVPQPLVSISKDPVLPTGIHSGASVSLENQSAPVLVSMTNIPTSDLSIPAGGIPQTSSDPGHGSQSASIMEMECGKIVEQDANRLHTSRQVKEPATDRGTEKDSKSTAEGTNLPPMTENIDKELQTGQHTGSSIQLNEQIQDLPRIPNFELNQMPAPARPEPVQSEQIQDLPRIPNIELNQTPAPAGPEPMQSDQIQDKPKNSNTEASQMFASAVPAPMQSEQIQNERKNSNIEVDELPVFAEPEAMQSDQIHEPRNLNVVLNEMPLSAEPEAMQSEQIHEPRNSNMELNEIPVSADPEKVQSVDKLGDKPDSLKPARGGDVVPSASRFVSEGSNLPEMSDPHNHGPSGETNKEDDIQPSGETTKSVEPDNPIGPDIL